MSSSSNGTKTATALALNEATGLQLPELDYVNCKTVDHSMLILKGTRLDNPENVKGLSGLGEVELQIGDERILFGQLTADTVSVNKDAMAFLFTCGLSSEDILSIAGDAKKAWCLGVKLSLAREKESADKIKKQSKVDKKSLILARIKARKK